MDMLDLSKALLQLEFGHVHGYIIRGWEETVSVGDVSRRRLWYSNELVTSGQVAHRLGVTPQTINNRRRTSKLLGLELEGHTSYHYPV
jgi:hypothetical protein